MLFYFCTFPKHSRRFAFPQRSNTFLLFYFSKLQLHFLLFQLPNSYTCLLFIIFLILSLLFYFSTFLILIGYFPANRAHVVAFHCPNALVPHRLLSESFQWGTAEKTESTLAGKDSTLRLPVAAEKVYFGSFFLSTRRLSKTLWCHTGWYLTTSNGAPRKVLNRPWLARIRRSDCLWLL